MGKCKTKQQLKKEAKALTISHPNSRKAARLSRQIIKEAARKKTKLNHQIKRNLFGERLLWFRDNLEPQVPCYTPEMLHQLFVKYLSRFDEEMEQIRIKHGIGQRKGRQHASREDTIRMTVERDTDEFNNAGLEMVDILHPKRLCEFRTWDGNLGRLSQFPVRRFSKTFFETQASKARTEPKSDEEKSKKSAPNTNDDQDTSDDDALHVVHVTDSMLSSYFGY